MIIPEGVDFFLEWTVNKGNAQTPEDFSGAVVKLIMCGRNGRFPIPFTIENNVVRAEFIGNEYTDGRYSFDLIWEKNGKNKGKLIAKNILTITSKPELVDVDLNQPGSTTISIHSVAVGIGYNGLDAYELYIKNGGSLSEEEWVKDAFNKAVNPLLDKIKDRYDVLPFGGFESMYNFGVKENTIIGTGNGTVYYDETEKAFFKAIEGTCYLNWDGDFPSSLYSHDTISFRVDKIYIDCSNTLLYAGTNDGSYIAINQTLSTTGRSTRFPMSQKAATDAINAVASKVIDARDVLPFGGFAKIADFSGTTSDSEGTGEGEVYYDETQYAFYKIIGNTLYLNWAGDYPSSVYTLDGNSFRTDKIYADSDNRKTYTGMSDGSYIEISSPISIYQTTGTSTSGTMSQSAITKLFDSLAGSVFIELGTLGVDFESLDTIKTKGAYTYKVNGRITPGKPVIVFNYILFVIDERQIRFGADGIMTRTLSLDNIWSEWGVLGGGTGELPIDNNWVNPSNERAPSTNLVNNRFNTIGNIIENFQKTIQTYADYEAIIEESAWGPHGIEPINPNNWIRLYREGVLVGHLIDGSECFINISSANANGYFLEGWYKPVDDPDNYIPINAQVVLGEEYVNGTSGEKCLRVTMSSNETNRAEAIDALNNCRVRPGISTYKQYADIVAKRQFGDYSIEGNCELYESDGNLLGILGDGGDSYVTINSATSNGVKVTGIYKYDKLWLPIDTVCYPDMHTDGRLRFNLHSNFGNPVNDTKEIKTSIGVLASLKTTAKNIVGAINELYDKFTGVVRKIKLNGQIYSPDSTGLVDLGTIEGGGGTGGSVSLDTTMPEVPTDTKAPSTKLMADEHAKLWNELHNNNYGNDWYGVLRSGDVATSDLIRIGNMLNHRTLPYHNKIRPCIVKPDRTINYYLDNNDITKKADGTDAVLDGTDGVVCVYYPAGYIIMASGQDQNLDLNAISLTPFAVNGIEGERFEAFVVSMDYATVRRSDNALMCVINETEDYAGSGANNTVGGIGYARTGVNNYNYTLYARNYGDGWTNSFFYFEQIKTALMIIEYATYNLTKAYNATLSAEGFKQGGLGTGPQNWVSGDWNTYNGYNPVIKIGEVQKYISGLSSNGTGVYTKTIQATETKSYTTPFPCWRWCSNLWGHLWNWYSGVDIDIQPNTSDTPYSTIYYTKQPNEVLATNDSDFTFVEKYIKIGLLPRGNGNFKELLSGLFLPKSNGGGSATWGCAYFWAGIPASRERRGVLSGATLHNGGYALRASALSANRPSYSTANVGSGLSAYVAE